MDCSSEARRFVGDTVEMLPVALILAAQLGVASTGQRVAIVASAERAEGQAPLRYAGRDADRMEAVLRDLGGFDRIERLRDPRPQALRAALDSVEQAAAHDPGLQMIFYYSGHADERGLLIGAERFSFDELRARLEGSRAAVRVALIDACYAGTMVQTKGGAQAPGYALDLVAPTRVRGAAIIAAGTATELAQESGEIEGSYFTHHLLSALRGAGDRDGDGVVTLAETYQYAYSHTLAATLPSVFGPQHPSYEYRLAGTGELPLTRLGRGHQALTFPPGDARTYLVSTSGAEVVAEVVSQLKGACDSFCRAGATGWRRARSGAPGWPRSSWRPKAATSLSSHRSFVRSRRKWPSPRAGGHFCATSCRWT